MYMIFSSSCVYASKPGINYRKCLMVYVRNRGIYQRFQIPFPYDRIVFVSCKFFSPNPLYIDKNIFVTTVANIDLTRH